MDRIRIEELLKKWSANTLEAQELEELDSLLTGPQRAQLEGQIAGIMEQQPSIAAATEAERATIFARIMAADKPARVITGSFLQKNRRWLGAAATLACLLSGTYLFLRQRQVKTPAVAVSQRLPEKEPGSNKAILTLDDNSVIELDNNGDRIIGTQGQSQVAVVGGKLAYQQQNSAAATIAYNRITTPRGGEFSITLSDGTRLWLNASSSVRFPATFTGNKREIELEGEAYFEVAEDKAHPFEVKIREKTVQVLGTQFNVMGYTDEAAIVATLVDGAVKVTAPGGSPKILTPGQHAVISNEASDIQVADADVDEETAWKNGRTYFNGADIRQIMRQISRWYNVDVQYDGEVQQLKFTCTVSRKDKLSKLLQLLEMTGTVHFKMENNTIIVHS